jgi:hypothetical protein
MWFARAVKRLLIETRGWKYLRSRMALRAVGQPGAQQVAENSRPSQCRAGWRPGRVEPAFRPASRSLIFRLRVGVSRRHSGERSSFSAACEVAPQSQRVEVGFRECVRTDLCSRRCDGKPGMKAPQARVMTAQPAGEAGMLGRGGKTIQSLGDDTVLTRTLQPLQAECSG